MSLKEVIVTPHKETAPHIPGKKDLLPHTGTLSDALGQATERLVLGRTALQLFGADKVLREANEEYLDNKGKILWTDKKLTDVKQFHNGTGFFVPAMNSVSLFWDTQISQDGFLPEDVKYRLAIAVIDAKKVFWYLQEAEAITDESLYIFGEDLPEGGSQYIDSSLAGLYEKVSPIVSRGTIVVNNSAIDDTREWIESGVDADINFLITGGRL